MLRVAESYGDGQVVWSVILLYFFGIYKGLPAEDSVTTTPRTSTFHYSTGSLGPQTKYSGTTYIWRAKRLISISTCKVSSCPSRRKTQKVWSLVLKSKI